MVSRASRRPQGHGSRCRAHDDQAKDRGRLDDEQDQPEHRLEALTEMRHRAPYNWPPCLPVTGQVVVRIRSLLGRPPGLVGRGCASSGSPRAPSASAEVALYLTEPAETIPDTYVRNVCRLQRPG